MPDVIVKDTTLDVLVNPTPPLSATSDELPPTTPSDSAPPAAPAPEDAKKDDAPTVEAGTTQEESATSTDDASGELSTEPKKPAKGVQKRIDELTRQIHESKEREAAQSGRLDAALKALERSTGAPADQARTDLETKDPEPKRDSFDDPDAYLQARVDWGVRRGVEIMRQEERARSVQQTAQQQHQKRLDTYVERERVFKAKTPDYISVAESDSVKVPMAAGFAIITAENGPEIKYHLGKNPEVARKLFDLDPVAVAVEIGRISAQLAIPKPPPVSAAPAPIPKLSATPSSATSKSRDEMTMEEYAADFAARQKKANPRTRFKGS